MSFQNDLQMMYGLASLIHPASRLDDPLFRQFSTSPKDAVQFVPIRVAPAEKQVGSLSINVSNDAVCAAIECSPPLLVAGLNRQAVSQADTPHGILKSRIAKFFDSHLQGRCDTGQRPGLRRARQPSLQVVQGRCRNFRPPDQFADTPAFLQARRANSYRQRIDIVPPILLMFVCHFVSPRRILPNRKSEQNLNISKKQV